MREIEHVNEDAELYALGTLGALDAARIERHVRTCDECARRVAQAEATVLRLIDDRTTRAIAPATTARRPGVRSSFLARLPGSCRQSRPPQPSRPS